MDKETTPSPEDYVRIFRRAAERFRQLGAPKDASLFDEMAQKHDDAYLERERLLTDDQIYAMREDHRVKVLRWESDVKYYNDWKLESLRATISLAQRALTAASVFNGGAAVALLAYIGNHGSSATDTRDALAVFASGVLLSGLAFTASYFAQNEYTAAAEDVRKPKTGWHAVAVVLGVASFVAFAGGIVSTYMTMSPNAASGSPGETRNRPPPKAPPPPPAAPTQPAPAKK
jgi:hypothetical protein